jgi:hypothetical protein
MHFLLHSPIGFLYEVGHDRDRRTQVGISFPDGAAVLSALGDSDPANPIAVEISRLVTAYTKNLRDHVERLGHIPADILRIKPRWPIEAVAMRMTTKAISESLSPPVSSE